MGFEKLETKKVGEVLTLKRGYDLPLRKRNKGEYPILSSSGISDYHNEPKVEGPGVTTGRSGLLGKVYYVEGPFWPLNTSLYVQDFKGNDPKYIYYLLQTLGLENYNTGSSVPTLNRNHVHLLDVSIPKVSIQIKIGELLFDFEKKIELNKSIISNLEKLAQTLFKRWFVDFEFPNENSEPYNSSGGEMVESELGIIPENWSIEELKNIAKQVGSTVNIQGLDKVVPHIGLADMPRGSIALSSWETSEEVTSNKTSFAKKDILFGKLRPYFKKVGIAPLNGICSTDIIVLNAIQQHYYAYLVCLVSRDAFIDYTTATANGTRMPRTGWRQMSKYQIVKPPKEIAERFNDLLVPFHEKILTIIHENTNLQNLRDTLLPKLLSGEIEIPDETEVTNDVSIS